MCREATNTKRKWRELNKSIFLKILHFLHLEVTFYFTNNNRSKVKGNFASFQLCLLCSVKHKLNFWIYSKNRILVSHTRCMVHPSSPPRKGFLAFPFCISLKGPQESLSTCDNTFKSVGSFTMMVRNKYIRIPPSSVRVVCK